ncbi:dihydrolipoyl dehydrogenase family protein [Aurantimonas endophytica]|uniref:Pyruvate/2-oxoglutarate dehydrogenase complex dihydrolipoamide dehydrogenase (E3) component n=1 Tax=Aurantimonas endophytica TaxID=1522175 RepID=A0A7W6HCZ7_9HYPH|nr:FAD-dependent oxidoreductase [Aurantimonas endophytica]MBB4002776.1 pyruvate/2-oxoglutarate dehydrogenase complex dihydrolipoamide dehydrogenase (E3) component [Aurantimonas endophytica]MCO6403653.1 FAD-dependent oxidoreductase [Aurantimonas endophytica]
MAEILTPDICVIGAGSGGLTTAAASAAFGVPVVLIERGRMGGDCLNYGCVPSKALLAAANHAATIREAPRFGVSAGEPQIDFAAVQRHVADVIATIAPNDSVERFESLGVTVLKASAEFVDARTVSAGGRLVRPRRFVIAAGSSPLVPPIEGLSATPHLTNETIFGLTTCPDHLVIIGGGPIGVEMAQAHRRLGAAVTVIDGETALGREDADLAAVVLDRLRAEGVSIEERTKVVRVEGEAGRIQIQVERRDGSTATIEGSHLLVAVGRAPNVAGLNLEAAGIDYDRRGIKVGRDLRTSNRRAYAIGDIAGGPQFTHLANLHAGLVVRAILFRLPIRAPRDTLPRVTYTDPPLGQVGLTAVEADAQGITTELLTWPYGENDRAQTERRTEGLIKLVVGRRGRLVGAGVVGHAADEITNLLSLAIGKGLSAGDLRDYVSPYPTLSEIGKRAATSYYVPYTRRPFVRRAVALLRRFG